MCAMPASGIIVKIVPMPARVAAIKSRVRMGASIRLMGPWPVGVVCVFMNRCYSVMGRLSDYSQSYQVERTGIATGYKRELIAFVRLIEN